VYTRVHYSIHRVYTSVYPRVHYPALGMTPIAPLVGGYLEAKA